MKSLLCCLFVVFCIACPAYAVDLIAPDLTGLLTEDGIGVYQMIMKEVSKRSGVKFTEKFYPPKRALRTFLKDENRCIYSFTDDAAEILGKDKIISSAPLGVFKMYIFTKKGKPALTSISQLKGKKVAGVLGLGVYNEKLKIKEAGVKVMMAENNDEAFRVLQKGRVHAIIAFLPDINPFVDELSYSPKNPLIVAYDRITCHNSETGKQFIDSISPTLKKMKEDGTIKKILGPLYLEE
ncbi:MAG: transporter substrate-binding domain-containing protein [Desulfobacterales bacterium]|nr:transporter substrate-binding domain-containing protein [Desulfobacterales bacterium]